MFRILFIGFLVSALLIPSMIGYTTKARKQVKTLPPDPTVTVDSTVDTGNTHIDQDIVFIQEYTNFAWGYQCTGSFIDKNGNVYDYDFSDDEKDMSLDEKLEKMRVIMNITQTKSQKFSEDDMKYLFELLAQIDEDAEFEDTGEACDYGQKSLYGIRYDEDSKPQQILIYSYGDVRREPDDKNALNLFKYYSPNGNI